MVMVGTGITFRGLDIPNVTHVINHDFPTNIDNYVHRIGRTGRAGKTGSALSFINEKNAGVIRELRDMLAENDQNIPLWMDQMAQYWSGSISGNGRSGNIAYGSREIPHSLGSQPSNGGYNDTRLGGGGTCK